ncbi:hypothetical protein IFM89_026372 [Coptis chinensis]|uniref:NAC domain-containing protein n=1 Tax=Coptis chinensis TaxID=261450 RepID=A0A835IDU5_9MAGN|nr:hypothetical protein IFM89_026372 [Coptis chinensis]
MFKGSSADEFFFYTLVKKKFGNGTYFDRKTATGTWKGQGKAKKIYDSENKSKIVGYMRTLNFFLDAGTQKDATGSWIMHEYMLEEHPCDQESWALCRIRRGRGNVSSSPSKKECSVPPPHCGNETAYSWKSATAFRKPMLSRKETLEKNIRANTQKAEYLLGLSDYYAATFCNEDQYEASSEIGIDQQREYMEPPQHGDTTEDITRFEQFENALEYFTNPANSQLLSDLMVDKPPQHGDTTEDVASF